jgi:hypothetical protein
MSVPTFTNFFFSHCGSEHIFCRPSSFLLCVGDFLFLAWFPFQSSRTSSTVLVVQVERQRLPNGVTTEIHTKRQHCKLVERRRLEAAVARRPETAETTRAEGGAEDSFHSQVVQLILDIFRRGLRGSFRRRGRNQDDVIIILRKTQVATEI